MPFGSRLISWTKKVEVRREAVFLGAGQEALRSIVEGSDLTGSPGQPVGQYGPGYNEGKVGGALKASWQRWFPSPHEQVIASDSPYAPSEEDGISYSHGGTEITQRSSVGGFHSVKQTIAAWERLVHVVAERVIAANP